MPIALPVMAFIEIMVVHFRPGIEIMMELVPAAAQQYEAAWWYGTCTDVQLTGVYYPNHYTSGYLHGILWCHWKGGQYSLKRATMKIRETTNV